MKLLTVILNYRTKEMTLRAVEAARAATVAIDGRICVVDNDSRDGSFDFLEDHAAGFDDVDVVASGHNGGYGAGNNFAIRRALSSDDPPEYVYLLNSDAFPEPDAVNALVEYMDAHPEVGIAGSAIFGVDGEPHVTAFRFPSLSSEALSGVRLGLLERALPEREVPIQPAPTATQPVDWLAGASMILRTRMLRATGLFDETFFLYFEETDLCRRARLAGWPTHYVVESRVAHVGHGSTGLKDKSRPLPTYWFDSRRHYLSKNHGRVYTALCNAAHAAGLTTFRVRQIVQRKPRSDPKRYLRDFLRYNFIERPP